MTGSSIQRRVRIIHREVEVTRNCSVIISLAQFASRYFGFLETSYGFRCVLSSETAVRWETDGVFVQLRYDAHRSYEVGLEIGQLTAEAARLGPPFTLGEVLGLAGFALADRPFFQTSTEERLEAATREIARLLVQYGKKFLLNDAEAFKSLSRQREQDCTSYAEERNVTRMRTAADKAWHERDYKAVVDLYREQMERLTLAETKRYEIALKRTETPT